MSTLQTSDLDHIKAALANAPSPTRSEARRTQHGLLAASLLVLAGTSSMHGMAALRDKPWPYTLAVTGAAGLFGLYAESVLRRFDTRPMGPARDLLRRTARLTLPTLLLGQVFGHLASPETLTAPHAEVMGHLGCLLLLLASGSLLALFGVRALRHADPLTPRITAATVGSVAGALASMAVSLQCPWSDPGHALLTHVLPVAAVIALTVRLGARALGLVAPTAR